MKKIITFIIFVLFSITYCCSQNFMMKMNVIEVYEDTTIHSNDIKVIWGIDRDGDLSLIWGAPEKMLYFDRKNKYASKKQQEELNDMMERYTTDPIEKELSRYIKINSLFRDRDNEIYLIRMYVDEGLIIWIKKVKDRTPCYFFRMVGQKQKL